MHLAGSAFDSDEWIDRIAAAPELEFERKKGNEKGNIDKNNKLKLVTKRRIVKSDSNSAEDVSASVTSTDANTTPLIRSSRAPAKRQKTSHQVSEAKEDNNQLQMPANLGNPNAQVSVHQDLCQDQQPVGLASNLTEINAQTQMNDPFQMVDHPQGNDSIHGSHHNQSHDPVQGSMFQDNRHAPQAP